MKGLQSHPEGTVLSIRVIPRAKKSAIAGWYGELLKVRLAAPPVEGKANQALIAFLAKELGIRKQRVEFLAGDRARQKRVLIRDLTTEEVKRRLALS
ncbi:MAG: YggU family protein [Chloroflexi bacterium]|nr:YggU family protein [Chloroflexota bacterium]